jgi:hypothetical protein
VTERELRLLVERGEAWGRTLSGLLAASERRLGELGEDPESSLSLYAAELQRVERVRTELSELRLLLEQLDARARALRTAWLGQQMRSGPAA